MEYTFGHPEIKQVGTAGAGDLFTGKRCLVTGASSGIGYGVAERLLQRGAAEVWICSRNEDRIRAAAETLNAKYGRVHWTVLDVSDTEGLKKYVDEMAAGGSIDYVFANAGVTSLGTFEDLTREELDRVMGPNFYGVFNANKAVIAHLVKQGSGHVLNMASMEGFIGTGYHAAYCASKFAVMGFTEALRQEYAPRGIKFSVICPGPVKSNIWRKDRNGDLNPNMKAPDTILSELEAADEILAGIEEGRNIIIVTDAARTIWRRQHEDPSAAERWAVRYTASNGELLTSLNGKDQ